MARHHKSEDKKRSRRLTAYVTERKFQQLQELMKQNGKMDMSMLIRQILDNRRIRVYVHDETLDHWLEELARLREEIRAIGVNINQITRHFNTYPEPIRKATYAKMAFAEYQNVQPRIEEIWMVMKKLTDKWLSE